MINIRYHIVSITAIFLALGIGTLLGSTFLDRATVDQLDRNINNAEARIAETEEANRRLQEEVQAAQARDAALIGASGSLLDGQLTDQPVLVVAAPGVDQAMVDTLRQILVNADADLRASISLRDDLASADGIDEEVLEALELDGDDPEAAREEVVDLLVEAMVAAGAPATEEVPEGEEPDAGTTTTAPAETTPPDDPGASTTTAPTTTPPDGDGEGDAGEEDAAGEEDPADEGPEGPAAPDGDQPEVLTALAEADLVAIDPGPAYAAEDPLLETVGYRYVYLSQPGLDPVADALLVELLPDTETDPPLPAVVVSESVPEPADGAEELPPTAVGLVRGDPERSRLYDTVDDIDTYLGLSSTVTLLRNDGGAAAGHYGQGGGATALAPAGR